MKTTTNQEEWATERNRLLLNTCTPLALKRADVNVMKPGLPGVEEITFPSFGFISEPTIKFRDVESDEDLYRKVRESGVDQVTVVGKGWIDHPSEKFVWRGSVDEFCRTWKGD